MNRRVPVQNLRGSDPTLLEVQLQNLLRRPMGQMALLNALDLVALSEVDDVPRSIRGELGRFVERCAKEVTEQPAATFAALLDELDEVPPERVPDTFRGWIAREAERDGRDARRIRGLVDRWAAVPAEPFVIGERSARVERGETAGRRGAATRERTRAQARTRARSPAAPRLDVGGGASAEARALIESIAMERLHRATDKGLAEPVLVAGIRHRAKGQGVDVTPADVTRALQGLKAAGRVRHSAGRWMSARTW